MQRLRLIEVIPLMARVTNHCQTSADVVDIINRAQERLIYHGNSKLGTHLKYRACVSDSCVTLPRELENIRAYALKTTPGVIRGQFFEFLEAGPGILDEDSSIGTQAVDLGEFPAFDDVRSGTKKIAVYAEQTESTGATITIQYTNSNNLWYRESVDGVWQDGETITLAAPGTYKYTTDNVAPNGLARVFKPITNGRIHLYEYDVDTGTYRPLAYYQPDETTPIYRRYLLPGLKNLVSGDCGKLSVTVIGNLRYIKAVNDNDFLMVSHIDALRLMVQAVSKEENNLFDEAIKFEANAHRLLGEQYNYHKGDGETQPLAMENRGVTGPAVETLI